MRIQFCGANRTVTGSCHLIEVNGLRLFLDMGMYQGPRETARRLNQWLPERAKSVDALILSHGHLDHCGKIPVLTRAGYDGPIYCTPATADVARIVLEDAAQIQEEDVNYLNRRAQAPGEEPLRPLYVKSDIPRVLKLMRRTPYGQRIDLGRGVSFTFHDAGHILGSAYVIIEWETGNAGEAGRHEGTEARREGNGRRSLLFTADLGRFDTPIIQDPAVLPGPVDHVIVESTYGGRVHAPMDEVAPQLLQAVQDCIKHRSRLLVPAFAVGRTQTILWYMQRFIQDKLIPPIPIYVDSPMGVEVSEVFRTHRDNYDDQTRDAIGERDLFAASRVTLARSVKESQRVNADNGPCVIIASSPTCEFGRILHHLKRSIERENDVIVFVGWTPWNTLGRRLQDAQKRVRIYDRWYEVRCGIQTIHGLSAHADGDELVRFLEPTITPHTQFFIVHGEEDQSESLGASLIARGAGRVVVPAMETSVIAV